MSLEKLIAEAIQENPLEVKEIFEEEMKTRVIEALEERYKNAMAEAEVLDEADEDDEDEDEDEDEDDDDMDEAACVREMKKLHAAACAKNEMYKRCNEKYGCSKGKFEALYAQYCKG